jgi:hypothetical protein
VYIKISISVNRRSKRKWGNLLTFLSGICFQPHYWPVPITFLHQDTHATISQENQKKGRFDLFTFRVTIQERILESDKHMQCHMSSRNVSSQKHWEWLFLSAIYWHFYFGESLESKKWGNVLLFSLKYAFNLVTNRICLLSERICLFSSANYPSAIAYLVAPRCSGTTKKNRGASGFPYEEHIDPGGKGGVLGEPLVPLKRI